MFPSDIFFFFETHSLANASPMFVSSVGIVTTQENDITYDHIFIRHLNQLDKAFEKQLENYGMSFDELRHCCESFVLPFIEKLNRVEVIQEWGLWNMKGLTLQFFVLLKACLTQLVDACELNKENEDPMDFPIQEMPRDVIWNIVLIGVTWSYGGVLNKTGRKIMDEQFGTYKGSFNINFNSVVRQRYTMFDIAFDIERLQWNLLIENLEFKLKVHFEPMMHSLLMPTPELSQTYFVIDRITRSMQKDSELNKNFRLVGPSSSSKTVALNTFMHKVSTPLSVVTVPMSSYLTLDRVKQKVESKYISSRKNTLTPRDKKKQIILVIDDIHM